jgi:hypothetical protein
MTAGGASSLPPQPASVATKIKPARRHRGSPGHRSCLAC